MRPIFILGVPRSGTTLLSFILDSHPHIAVGRETGIMKSMAYVIGDAYTGENEVLQRWYERYSVSRKEMIAQIRDFVSRFFESFVKKEGKKRWGEKTPIHTPFCELILEIFPEAQFVHIIRDPREVYASRKHWPRGPVEVAEEWQTENLRLLEFSKKLSKKQYFFLTYKDLILNTEQVLKELFAFLGEPWNDCVLRHQTIVSEKYIAENKSNFGIKAVQDREVNGRIVVEGGYQNDPSRGIDKNSLGKWIMRLRKSEIKAIQKHAEKGMTEFGYKKASGLIPLIGKVSCKD